MSSWNKYFLSQQSKYWHIADFDFLNEPMLAVCVCFKKKGPCFDIYMNFIQVFENLQIIMLEILEIWLNFSFNEDILILRNEK